MRERHNLQSESSGILPICSPGDRKIKGAAQWLYHVYHGQYEYFPGSDVIIATKWHRRKTTCDYTAVVQKRAVIGLCQLLWAVYYLERFVYIP